MLRIETALARGSLTQVERRDPKMLDHKMRNQDLEALSPSFRWKEYFSGAGQPGLQSLNVTAPDFFKTMDATLKKERPQQLEGLPALAVSQTRTRPTSLRLL